MEEEIRKALGLKEPDPGSYSPLALAYMGDAVYELIIRTVLLDDGNRQASKLHRDSVKYVSGRTQAGIIRNFLDNEILTEEEKAVYLRGRNAKPYSTAKNLSKGEYHAATGFEALIGYLYLSGENDRLFELVRLGIGIVDAEKPPGRL